MIPSTPPHSPLGSLWHRWDPHLHAPGTLLNDQFKGDWEAYLARIESASPVIAALGVTDYFCIQTYREVKERKRAGRLPGVQFLFPNVEMRIETKTADERAINIHLLFSPADSDHEAQIERILGHLVFDFKGTTYRCERNQLIALGKNFDPSQKDDAAAMKIGANQFKTSLKDLKALFKRERWMRENALVAIASKSGDGTAGLQEDAAFAAMRIELERFADVIFSGRDKDRRFWLGEEPNFGPAFIEERYRSRKPCLNGSDAHSGATAGEPAQDRFCWLKGDLTFETLRQAVVEPGERVSIGPHPPSHAVPAAIVRRVSFTDAPWMKKVAVDLNGGLGPATVTLTWGDDTTTGRRMLPDGSSDEPEAVRYLSQHFVERLCSAEGLATDLRAAMERVVFESTDPLDRLEADTFDELAQRLLEPIRTTYADLLQPESR
jgi:hypothetical protein